MTAQTLLADHLTPSSGERERASEALARDLLSLSGTAARDSETWTLSRRADVANVIEVRGPDRAGCIVWDPTGISDLWQVGPIGDAGRLHPEQVVPLKYDRSSGTWRGQRHEDAATEVIEALLAALL